MRNIIFKEFLVVSNSKKIITKSQVKNTNETIFLNNGEILLNPGEIEEIIEGSGIQYIREISRISKSVEFDEYEILTNGKIIFSARLIESIEFKVSKNPCCPEFSGRLLFKSIQIPFEGFIECRGLKIHNKADFYGFVDGDIDRPKIGIPFLAVNESDGDKDKRIYQKLPGAIIIQDKSIVKVYARIS